jgi:hypothetical protein
MGHASGQIYVNHALGRTFLGFVKLLGSMRLDLEKVGKRKAETPDKTDV